MPTKQIAWTTGNGNITLTYQGQGDGNISVESDQNVLATVRSQTITIETTKGGLKTKNLTITQGACPVPVGTVLNYAYTGSYQEIILPAGQYKLQCWGAQGGSNAAASSYGITAQAGGKGGYSEGILTLTSNTRVRIYVGGVGTSSDGGFNGGGSTTGSSTYNASDEQGVSRMGGGGGATDIRLSDAALLSRMIVAGGGAGGSMCYQKKTTTVTTWSTVTTFTISSTIHTTNPYSCYCAYWNHVESYFTSGKKYRFVRKSGSTPSYIWMDFLTSSSSWISRITPNTSSFTYNPPSNMGWIQLYIGYSSSTATGDVELQVETTSSTTTTSNESQVGGVGGGTQGGGYSTTYVGKQNAAGNDGAFGQGANQAVTNYRYCSGAGGGGWYGGGGGQKSDSSMTTCKYSGGGSGWVNIAANAGNRPSGYTGLQLDSGETKAGNTSFPSTSGGTETGHSGNGYAKITRLS